jgi:acyl transferase domain-containing protein
MSGSAGMNDEDIIAKALAEIRRLKAENGELRALAGTGTVAAPQDKPGLEPIAVIGFACRTPGEGDTPEALWNLLKEGRSTVTEVPSYRWSVDNYYDPDPDAPGKLRCRFGSFLGRVEDFDCKLFGISPMEASYMDPQQRVLLELAWEALEDANQPIEKLKGSTTGVFIGQSGFDFATQHLTEESLREITPYVGTGCALSPAAGRISYTFDFKGPSYVVDTACSSSLVALHNACQSLRHGESTLALVGAANLILAPGMSINFDKVGMLCEDGIVKTFDKDAHGVVRAEGGGMVVLKRLDAALRDGDRIDGLILGSAISQDGASSSLMAPSGNAQREVMKAALKAAGLGAAHIDVVEAHGTATLLGDPTELNALLDVYCRTPRAAPLLVGSVKTNFGHMEASAGIIGFIKLLLSLRHEHLPPHLNYSEGHPDVDWANEAISVCTQGRPWSRGSRRRVAGLSGFGFSGTNAHVILAEAPLAAANAAVDAAATETPLLLLSAASPAALQGNAAALADWLEQHPELSPAAICQTWALRRKRQASRLALVAGDRADVIARLRRFSEAGKAKGCASGSVQTRSGRLSVAMVCGGHGAQYAGMSAGLYRDEPVFRAAFDQASALASRHAGIDLRALVHEAPKAAASKGFAGGTQVEGELGRTLIAQLAIFCVQYALAQQWRAWGVEPKLLLGHSLGEYTAACLAEVFSLEDAVLLIAERARLMEAHTPAGAMLTAFHDESAVQAIVAAYPDAGIAAVNGPGIVLVSGTVASIAAIAQRIDAEGGRTTAVPIDRAFHSPLVDAVLPRFEQVLKQVKFSAPRIPIISNLSGGVAGPELATVDYWLRHSREPVRFMQGMQTLHGAQLDAFIDLSPEPAMMGLDLCYQEIRERAGSRGVWVPSLRNGSDDRTRMLESLGRLYCLGLNPDGERLFQKAAAPVRLPTYRFDRQRCWSAAAERGQKAAAVATPITPVAPVAPAPVAPVAPVVSAPIVAPANGAADLHRVMLEHMAVMEQYLQLTHGKNSTR